MLLALDKVTNQNMKLYISNDSSFVLFFTSWTWQILRCPYLPVPHHSSLYLSLQDFMTVRSLSRATETCLVNMDRPEILGSCALLGLPSSNNKCELEDKYPNFLTSNEVQL